MYAGKSSSSVIHCMQWSNTNITGWQEQITENGVGAMSHVLGTVSSKLDPSMGPHKTA